MQLKHLEHNLVDEESWDHNLTNFPLSNFLHSYKWMKYISEFDNVVSHNSFFLTDLEGKVVAFCPLIVYRLSYESNDFLSIGSNSQYTLGFPLVQSKTSSMRKKLFKYIIDYYHSFARNHDIKTMETISHPLSKSFCDRESTSMDRFFEPLKYKNLDRIVNTSILDLQYSIDALEKNLGKYHRRHIRRTEKKGISLEVIDSTTEENALKDFFKGFQEAHFTSAGKSTRPPQTWNTMKEMIKRDKAILFVAKIKNTIISYLLCGKFRNMSWGWSQVNIEKYEKEYSPRHFLEWQSILYLKNEGFDFYEIGDISYHPSPFYIPSEKELSISMFKERYGACLLPKVYWTYFFDEELGLKISKQKTSNFLNNFYAGD